MPGRCWQPPPPARIKTAPCGRGRCSLNTNEPGDLNAWLDDDEDELAPRLGQLPLFAEAENSTGSMELFPKIWGAAEAWASTDQPARRKALEVIDSSKAARLSPLVAYLLAASLAEPDTVLRARVISILGEALGPGEDGLPAPEAVRQTLRTALSQMRTRRVYALLQAAAGQPSLENAVVRLLNASTYAGNHLADILASRQAPMELRRLAVQMIARVGYLDAIPALERIQARLEARRNGQSTLPFAYTSAEDEASLLPEVEAALVQLRSN